MSLHFGRSLGPFAVGQTLLSVTEMIRSQLPDSNASILFDETASSSRDIIVLVTGLKKDLYVLRFDPALQILRSVTYSLPPSSAGKTDAQKIYGTHNLSLKRAFTIRDIIDNFGRPKAFNIQSCRAGSAKAAFLVYDGACLVFQLHKPEHGGVRNVQELSELKSRLFEVRVAPKDDSSLCTTWKGLPLAKIQPTDFDLPVVHLIVHGMSKAMTGLQISYPSDDQSDSELPATTEATRVVCFGDRCEDVLSALGTPDEVYYKDSRHSKSVGDLGDSQIVSKQSGLKSDVSYAYRHLGMDVLFDSGKNAVSKLVLHSNVPDHYEFCRYSRCFFKFSVSKDGVSSSSGRSTSSKELLVTAATNWNVVRTHVDSSLATRLRTCHYGPSTNSTYPFPDTNLWALFDQFIVEVTDSARIAKLTILSPPRSLILQSRSAHETTIVSPSNTPLPIREVETSVITSEPDRQASRETDSDDEFQDCREDSFHSAESSLTNGQIPTQSAGDKPRTVTAVHKAYFSPNINVVIPDQNSDLPRSYPEETTPVLPLTMSVVFEFQDVDDSRDNESPATASFTITTSTCSPDSPEITDSHLSDVEVASRSSREPSPELSSFDFVSFSEILESQEPMADVSPSDHEPSSLQNTPGDSSETVDSSKVTQAGIKSPSSSGGDSQALLVEGFDSQGQSKPAGEGSEGASESQETTTSSPESSFRYQPRPAAATASRTMALSQDIGLLMKSTHGPSREPSTSSAASNVHATRLPQRKVGRVPNIGSASRERTKSDQRGSPKDVTKGATKPSPSAVSPAASKRQPRKLIVQQRAGSSVSAREEAHRRLLSHTKSSQQRVKQKYVPKKVATEEMKEEEEGEGGGRGGM